MPPINLNEWWLAAAAATSVVSPLTHAAVQAGDHVGVVTAARPGVNSTPADKVVYVGNDVLFGQRFTTDKVGAVHILFMDQSSITLGPNSTLTIDEFSFHPEKQEGRITVSLLKGVLRVVGGLVSKYSDTRVITSNATIGIRGGITLVEADEDETRGIFLFGQFMSMTSVDGGMRTVTRPGFGIRSSRSGLSEPFRIPATELARFLERFESRASTRSDGEVFTPAGQLVSTIDRPLATDTPGKTLAVDRLDKVIEDLNGRDPENSLGDLIGLGVAPIQS